MTQAAKQNWEAGDPYEQYVGRWSRKVAREFLAWLQVPARKTWGMLILNRLDSGSS